MIKLQEIVESLSQFNNVKLSKKQWDIVLKGCGCPKSSLFWYALREHNLSKEDRLYTLLNINEESFNKVWENYCIANRASAKKTYDKNKLRAQAKAKAQQCKGITFYMVGGYLTTEKPYEE